MPSHEQKQSPAPPPNANLFLETFKETRKLYQPEKIHDEKLGSGFRFCFGETTFTVHKPAGASPRVALHAPGQAIRMIDVTAMHAVAEKEAEPAGILITSPTLNIFVTSDGSYTAEHLAPGSEKQPSQILAVSSTVIKADGEQQLTATKPPSQEKPGKIAAGTEQKEKQRIKASGFFGKMLDNFPRETEGEEKRRIYKFLIGNKAAEQPDDGKEKIDWITVVAHASHVVKYLDEHVDDFKKRETQLTVEGYYQEFETTLRRSGRVKKTQELYALSIQVKEEQ